MEERRLIDANAAIENADKRYSEWNLAMAAAEGNRQISMVYKKRELFKAVRKVIESCHPLTRKPCGLNPSGNLTLTDFPASISGVRNVTTLTVLLTIIVENAVQR